MLDLNPALINQLSDYIILPRQLWMSEIAGTDITIHSLERISGDKIQDLIEIKLLNDDTPLHLAEIQSVEDNVGVIEKCRFFVLP